MKHFERLLTAQAADIADWAQVAANLSYGPPCFHLQDDVTFCLRAKTWEGHDEDHKFVSLRELLVDAMRAEVEP